MLGDSSHCLGQRRDGAPCQAQALLSSGYCFAHDPGNQANAAKARAAGGRAKSRAARVEKLVPAVLRPVLYTLLVALRDTQNGSLTPGQAQAMASVAGAVVRVYQSGTMEERLAALESAAATNTGRRLA